MFNDATHETYVVQDPRLYADWNFYVESKAEYVSEVTTECYGVVENVLDAVGGFYTPESAEVRFTEFESNVPAEEIFDFDTHDREYITESFGFSDRAFLPALEQVIEKKYDDERTMLDQVEFAPGPTTICTGEETKPVTTDCDVYRQYSDSGYVSPTRDPLSVNIRYTSTEKSRDVPMRFWVQVFTPTTIWFEESERGQRNGERLGWVLENLTDRLEPYRIRFFADMFSEDTVDRKYPELSPQRLLERSPNAE